MNDQMRESRLRGSNAFPFVLYEMPYGEQPLAAALHWQEDVEILIVNAGALELNLDSTLMTLQTGDVVCINPGQLHGFRGLTFDAQCDIFIFPLQHLLFLQEDHDQRRFLRPLAEGQLGFPLFLSAYPKAQQVLFQITELQKKKPLAYELSTKAFLVQLIVLLVQSDALIPLRPAKHNDICKEILTYIRLHFAEKLTVPDIAFAVGISPTYFSTFFRRHFFQHFSDYLCRYRIEQACVLLAGSSMSITDIALATGFCSGSHFIRQFRTVMGMTPFAYRQTMEAR